VKKLSAFEHMDLLMQAYDKVDAFEICKDMFGYSEGRAIAKDITELSFGDSWAFGEQLVAMRWGLS